MRFKRPQTLICVKLMNKSSEDIEGPKKNIFGDTMSEDDFLKDEDEEFDMINEEGHCEVFDAVMSAIFLSRPLGILFDEDLIIDFLQSRKYRIVERTDDDGEVYSVPVKVGSKVIPDSKSALRKVFDREVQETLITWMKSIKK